jgi:hypothetical protein
MNAGLEVGFGGQRCFFMRFPKQGAAAENKGMQNLMVIGRGTRAFTGCKARDDHD